MATITESDSPTSSMSIPSAPCARVMPPKFQAKPGVEIIDGIFLGRELGAGVQAKVFDLVYADGSPVGKVLKIGHTDLGHTLFLSQFASSMMDMRREWELGMVLKTALEEPDGSLPGFTRTCDCVVVMKDEKKGTATFQGMILERLNGWPIEKRVTDPSFHNINYVREMLFQVLSALDRAQRSLGFNHADLGLGNVFEHYPKLFPELQEEEKNANSAVLAEATQGCKTPACGCSPDSPVQPGRSATWRRVQAGPGCSMPPSITGYSCDADGGLLPLGPHVEFKIIDYGVGEFNEVLAQAAGGHEPEETLRRIHGVFADRGIALGSDSKQALDLETGRDIPTGSGNKKPWKLHPFGKSEDNRFTVSPNGGSSCFKASPKPDIDDSKRSSTSLSSLSKTRGPVERMYRHFWNRKGDVFHIILALARALDDRVWPKHDEREVHLFVSLVYHVTGVKMKAHFAAPDDVQRPRVMGKRRKRGKSASGESRPALYGARVRCFAALRRAHIMLAAHLKPFNSGLLAGEALVAPFFGVKGAPHAELPVCIEAAFPFRQS